MLFRTPARFFKNNLYSQGLRIVEFLGFPAAGDSQKLSVEAVPVYSEECQDSYNYLSRGLDGSRHILSSISICRDKSLVRSTLRLLCSIAPTIKPIKSKIPPQPRRVLPIIRDWLGGLVWTDVSDDGVPWGELCIFSASNSSFNS